MNIRRSKPDPQKMPKYGLVDPQFTVPCEDYKQRDDETVRRLQEEVASQDNRDALMTGDICR